MDLSDLILFCANAGVSCFMFIMECTALYWIIIYIKLSKNEECCIKRHSIIIDISGLIGSVALTLNNVSHIIREMFGDTLINYIARWILTQTLVVCIVIAMVKYAQHIYGIYYETKFAKEVNRQRLAKLLDNTVQSNWFVNNRDTWGNKKFMNKISGVIIIIYAVTWIMIFIIREVFIIFDNEQYFVIFHLIGAVYVTPLVIPTIFMIILYIKFKSFNDVFMIIKQFKYNVIIGLAGSAVFVGLRIGQIAFEDTPYEDYLLLVMIASLSMTLNGIVYIDTYWVIRTVIKHHSRSASTQLQSTPSTESVKINAVFSNIDTLNKMLEHLTKEFSSEILLSYIEFRQYEHFVMNTLKITAEDQYLRVFPEVPISHTIKRYQNNNELSDVLKCKYIAYDLYNKYICDGSKYQININYKARKELVNIMDDKHVWLSLNVDNSKLFDLFDSCAKQMKQLLHYSLNRANKINVL